MALKVWVGGYLVIFEQTSKYKVTILDLIAEPGGMEIRLTDSVKDMTGDKFVSFLAALKNFSEISA